MYVRISVFAVLCWLSLVAATCAQTTKFTVDNGHSSVIFGIGHLGLSYTYGRFNKVSGEFSLDPTDVAKSQFQISIESSSVDTNDPQRDEHLRSPEFFDAPKFPAIEFVSTAVVKSEKGFDVQGKMTLHGITKEISIPLVKVGEGNSPSGDYRAGFLTQFALKRSEYDMKNLLNMIGDDVSITFSFEGVKQP